MRYLILILTFMTVCYGSSGYTIGRKFISALGSCETSARRVTGYGDLRAVITCQHGRVAIFGNPLSLSIMVNTEDPNDEEDLSHMSLDMTVSYYSGEYEYKPSANVISFDRLGIAEKFSYDISDEEIKSIYKGLIQGRTFHIRK